MPKPSMAAAFDQFIDVRSKSDREVAELLHALGIDIAIDLAGHTQHGRLGILAMRPAPIQASYLGFPATTGADFIDYIIADAIVLPFDQQPCYTERIVHLPDSYQVNDSRRAIAARTPAREELGLPAQDVVFCCFNNTWKMAPPVFDVWMRLLDRVAGSVLWLRCDKPRAEANLRSEAAARGIDPARLVFADTLPDYRDHLARHRVADLFLDTLPFNAHTTASDALWAGLPVLTCRGRTFSGRVAASLLNAVGLPQLVTESLDEYEALALRLATEPALLRAFRRTLEENRLRSPLFDTARLCRHIEAAYTMIERMFPDLPKLELFARQARPGWEVWGNQVNKFDNGYDAQDDVTKSFDAAYEAMRQRVAKGGPGWAPKCSPKTLPLMTFQARPSCGT